MSTAIHDFWESYESQVIRAFGSKVDASTRRLMRQAFYFGIVVSVAVMDTVDEHGDESDHRAVAIAMLRRAASEYLEESLSDRH